MRDLWREWNHLVQAVHIVRKWGASGWQAITPQNVGEEIGRLFSRERARCILWHFFLN